MSDEPTTDDATADDEMKRKFREALDRKNAEQHGTSSGPGSEGKVHGAHGSESHQKSFRRKAGG